MPEIQIDMEADEFRQYIALLAERLPLWVVLADAKPGFVPVCIVVTAQYPITGTLILIGASWFPWASKRNIVEGTIAFFNAIRNDFPATFYAVRNEEKSLYEVCMKHGVIRRVGTSFIAFPGQQAAVYETRMK